MQDKLQIAIFGSDGDHCNKETYELAIKVGEEVSKSGNILLTGGGEGVMKYASKGAYQNGGIVVGILPGAKKTDGNGYCNIVIPTEIGFARGQILANAADAAIVIEGGFGTRNEVGETYWRMIPTVAISNSGGTASEIAGKYIDKRSLIKIYSAESAEEAVAKAIRLANNRKNLEQRLGDVSLDLTIYRKAPDKFIRINPRNQIAIKELEDKLRENYNLDVEFEETKIKGIYQSSNANIGGYIYGVINRFFNDNYFIQDLASVICVEELDLEQGNSFLETCAATGFKSILAYDLMKGKVKIRALDVDPIKYQRMLAFFKQFNVGAETDLIDATQFNSNYKFDSILVDAPCSSEGMNVVYDSDLKKDVGGFGKVVEYSNEDIERFSVLQLRLLQKGYGCLKENGTLIYATCSLNKIENEGVVIRFLEENKDASVVNVDMDKYGIKHTSSNLGIRIIPDKTKGFYFTKIKKT